MDLHRHPAGGHRQVATAGRAASLAAVGLAVLLLVAAALGPRTGRFGLLPVRSGSMAPALAPGSLAVVVPAPTRDVEVGDVVAFRPPGSDVTVTHRVVDVDRSDGTTVVTTRGDANPAADPAPVRLVGQRVWTVRHVVPHAGRVIRILASGPVRLLLAAAVGLVLLLAALRRVWRTAPPPARAVVRLRRRPAGPVATPRTVIRLRRRPAAAPATATAPARVVLRRRPELVGR